MKSNAKKPNSYRKGKKGSTRGSQSYKKEWGKGKRNFEDEEAPSSDSRNLHPFNEPWWYDKNPDLTVAAGSIPFPYRPGDRVASRIFKVLDTKAQSVRYRNLPGILTLNWIPSLGHSDSPNSPISVAARQIYAKVRSQFSGSLEADAPDFVIYLGALDSIFSYIAALKRLYRLVNSYSPNNHFIPEGVFQALGVSNENYQDLINNKMTFFGSINQLIGMTDRFVCPSVFPMFNRHYWLNDNVYMDFPSMNAQFYAFVEEAFYKFTLTDDPLNDVKVGGLSCESFPTEVADDGSFVTALFEFGVSLISALSESDDAYTISGYLMRAYDGQPKFTVDRLGIDERFDALYVPEVLAQIENACSLGVGLDKIQNEVTQVPAQNIVYTLPTAELTVPSSKQITQPAPLISIRNDKPTAMDVVEASRLASYFDFTDIAYNTGDTAVDVPIIAGTEIVTTMVVTEGYNGTYTSYPVSQSNAGNVLANSLTGAISVSMFDWAPRVIVGGPSTTNDNMLWDVHNVTQLTVEQVEQINRVCLYSEFDSFSRDTKG